MAERVPEDPTPPRPRFPHGWLTYERYLTIHWASLRRLEDEGIVLRNGLSLREDRAANGELAEADISGRIQCAGGVALQVREALEARTRRDGRVEVRGVDYTYHAWRGAGSGQRLLFRYDMAHGGLHLHSPDPATGEEAGRTPVPIEALPNLDQLIRYAVALAARRG